MTGDIIMSLDSWHLSFYASHFRVADLHDVCFRLMVELFCISFRL